MPDGTWRGRRFGQTHNGNGGLFDQVSDAGQVLDEPFKVAMILASMPDSFESLIQALESRPETELTLDFIKSKLMDQHSKRVAKSGGPDTEKAMKSEKKNIKPKRTCFFCKKSGHFRKDCKKFLAQKHEDGSNKKYAKEKAKHVQDSSEGVCFAAGAINGCWIIDSGAMSYDKCHMTNNKSFFSSFTESAGSDISLANGNRTRVASYGNGTIVGINGKSKSVNITLKDVLFVPEFEGGLLSVSRMAEKGFTVNFGEIGCEIFNTTGIIAVDERIGKLYRLKTTNQSLKAVGNHHEQCQHTWHRRFGHRDPEIIRTITIRDLADGFNVTDCGARIICECYLKVARIPFPKVAERKTMRSLELVHTDLCGPMSITTPGGNKYFITMIDDFSHFAVVYLLKTKSEAANKLKHYVRWTENLFGRKLTTIQFDGGGENKCQELQHFFESEGIRAQIPTPYTPQQNGSGKKK